MPAPQRKPREPTARKGEVDEFKKLLNLSLNGSPEVAESAQENLLRLFKVKVVRADTVFH